MKLYEIAASIEAALSQTDEDGQFLPGVEKDLDALDMLLTDKAEGIAAYMAQLDAESTAYSDQIDRLKDLKSSAENRRDRLKEYLKGTMERLGTTSIATKLFKLSVCKNSMPTVKLSGELIPPQYQRATVTLDAKKVIEDFRECRPIPDCLSVVQGTHLRVK